MQDAIHGVTLELLAEVNAKHNELKTRYGERGFQPHFQQLLATKGIDENSWAHAWNGWWSRMESDPSGNLMMRFHQIESELSTKAHFGDVPDMSQEVRGGITLEQYAYVSARQTAPGADFTTLLAECNITMETWNTGMQAWVQAMSQDNTHRITTQYGQLYAKHNPAQVQAMQQAAFQNLHQQMNQPAVDEPEEEYTFEKAMQEVRSPVLETRYKAAHLLAQKVQTELESDPQRRQAALRACVPQLLEALERFDKKTVSDAEAAARDLVELGIFGDDCHQTIQIAYARGSEHLQTLRAAFAPIQHRNVPERVSLQQEIQDYESLTETLQEILSEWADSAGRARQAATPAASATSLPGAQVPSAGQVADQVGQTTGLLARLLGIFR